MTLIDLLRIPFRLKLLVCNANITYVRDGVLRNRNSNTSIILATCCLQICVGITTEIESLRKI